MNGGAIIDHIIEHGAHFALVDRDGIPAFETLGKVIQCVAVLYSRLRFQVRQMTAFEFLYERLKGLRRG